MRNLGAVIGWRVCHVTGPDLGTGVLEVGSVVGGVDGVGSIDWG